MFEKLNTRHTFWICLLGCIKRSTPRVQTSATSSLKSVKQSTQAWNSVAYCFLCPHPETFMNVHPSGITWCCQQTRTQEIEKGTLCPRGNTDHPQNVPDCLLCHSQHILKISWKSTHRFYRGFAKKNTPGAPGWETVKQPRQVWNSLAYHFLCHAWRFIKISWKSVHPLFHNITNKHRSRK